MILRTVLVGLSLDRPMKILAPMEMKSPVERERQRRPAPPTNSFKH